MKNFTHLVLISLLLLAAGCKKTEKDLIPQSGEVQFSMANSAKSNGVLSGSPEAAVPAFVLLSFTDEQGKATVSDKKMALYLFGEDFVSEVLKLNTGNYKLSKFLVLDAGNKIIYASPLSGSPQAQYVSKPLPLGFSITANSSTLVSPQVLKVEANTPPESFGYASFGFEVVNTNYIPLLLDVKFLIGDFIYEKLDAKFIITAYRPTDTLISEFNYSGVRDTVLIKDGYDNYEIKMQKWGITDKQVISHNDLIKDRADGLNPVSYGFAGTKPKKMLHYYIEYLEQANNSMTPTAKTVYTYTSWDTRLQFAEHYNYHTNTLSFEPDIIETFIYDPLNTSKVSKIYNYPWDVQSQAWGITPLKEVIYDYSSPDNYQGLSKITEKDLLSGINTVANFQFIHNPGYVTYTLSNGTAFSYYYKFSLKNIKEDYTVNGGQICNKGVYQYDYQINPFKHLGYVDIYLRNFSISNKLSENVDYTGCSSPTLKALWHEYEYDQDGYPTVKITHYSNNRSGKTTFHYY